ncbi:MAG: sigma-70 factor domain-containing protein, partial [Acidimicrobiia bacterium]
MKNLPAFADRAAGPSSEAGQATGVTSDPVRMYLREITKVPLLTAAQEVDLAMRIEGGELAAELLTSVQRTGRLDRRRFQQVVEAAVRIRRHQRDPEQKLGREGIG